MHFWLYRKNKYNFLHKLSAYSWFLWSGCFTHVPSEWDSPPCCRCRKCCHHFVPSKWMSERSNPRTGRGRSTGGSPCRIHNWNKQGIVYFLFVVFGQEVNQMNQTLSVMAPDRKCQDVSDAGCTRWEVHQQCLLHVASVPAFFGDWPICALTGAIPRIFKRVLSTSSCTLYNYQLFKICCQMIYFIHSWKCTQNTGFLKLAQRGKFL